MGRRSGGHVHRERTGARQGTPGLAPGLLVVLGLLLLVGVGTGVAAGQSGDPTSLDGCTTISEPGAYVLAADDAALEGACIVVGSSDVVLDGAGRTLSNAANATDGVRVAQVANVTVHDLVLDGFDDAGAYVSASDDVTLRNVSVDASARGVWFEGGSGGRLVDVDVTGSGTDGVLVQRTLDLEVRRGSVASSGTEGVHLSGADGTRVAGTVLEGNDVGLLVRSSGDVLARDLRVSSSGSWDVEVADAGSPMLEGLVLDGDTLDLRGHDVRVRAVASPAAVPEDVRVLGPHVEVAEALAEVPDPWWNATFAYDPATVDAYQEDTVRWWRWDGEAWGEVAGWNAVDEAADEVQANATSLGTVAPMVREDGTPPDTSIRIGGTPSATGWFTTEPVLNLTASDDWSGVARTELRVGGGNWTTVDGPVTVDERGEVRVEARSRDVAGNLEPTESTTLQVDPDPPRTTVDAPPGWVNRSVEVRWNASDVASGLAGTELNRNGTGWSPVEGPVTVEAEGEHALGFRSHDVAGNLEPNRTSVVRIDRTPPGTGASVVGERADDGSIVDAAEVVLQASDALSGVASTSVRVDGGAWTPVEGSVEVTSTGLHEVEFRSRDVAGNLEPAGAVAFEVVPASTGTDGGDGTSTADGNGSSPEGGTGEPEVRVMEDDVADRPEVRRVEVRGLDDPANVTLVARGPGGGETLLGPGPSAPWDTGDGENGRYRVEALRSDGAGGSVVVASTGVLVENPRATLVQAAVAVAAGVLAVAALPATTAAGGRLLDLLRYLVRTVRRALGIEYRERTREGTALRDRVPAEALAALVGAAVLAWAVTHADVVPFSLAGFLADLPMLGGAAVVFSLVWLGSDRWIATATGDEAEYVLLGSGLVSLLATTLAVRSPFGVPGFVDKRGADAREGSDLERLQAFRTLADMGAVASASLLFVPAMRWGPYGFGETGALLVVMTLATGAVPVRPLPNHHVWSWSKPVALLVLAGGVGLYVTWQLALLPHAVLVALGAVGLVGVGAFVRAYGDLPWRFWHPG